MQTSVRYILFAVTASVLVLVVGCAQTPKEAVPAAGYSVHVEKAPPGYQPPIGVEDVEDVEDLDLPPRPPESLPLNILIGNTEDGEEYGVVDVIHFDYDKSDIKSEFVRGLESNARWMREHADYQMLIEGHCDERGTNEYNMALGERRAMAARNFLVQQGVDPNRIHIKSWGEEKPVAFGHDETSWSQNRRAEFRVGRLSE